MVPRDIRLLVMATLAWSLACFLLPSRVSAGDPSFHAPPALLSGADTSCPARETPPLQEGERAEEESLAELEYELALAASATLELARGEAEVPAPRSTYVDPPAPVELLLVSDGSPRGPPSRA